MSTTCSVLSFSILCLTYLIPVLAFLGKAVRRDIVNGKDLEHRYILRCMRD